ncbi:TraX family protein [Blautia sp. HCP3S3_H10_1]|uniref:TraX family protein n=1 Tax=unclassified Blautia TaxID=2648079 RepID=UPI003F8FF4C8
MMGKRGVVWKTPDITADGLKMFACVCMLIRTIGIVVIEKGMIHLDTYTQESLNQAMAQDSRLMTLAGLGSVFQLVGGMALPIFAFLLVEGIRNTSDYKKYLITMLFTAFFSEIPYDLAMSGKVLDFSAQNGLFTMSICLILLKCLELTENIKGAAGGLVKLLEILAAVLWTNILRSEYGLCMVLLTAIFYLLYTRNVMKTILGGLVSLMYVTGPLAFYELWCYNGERKDRINKYVYYAVYPVSLLVLFIVVQVLNF